MPFLPLYCEYKAKLFCLQSFVTVSQAGVFTRKHFHPGYRHIDSRSGQVRPRFSKASETSRAGKVK